MSSVESVRSRRVSRAETAPPDGRARALRRQKTLDKIQHDKIDRLISVETKIATVKSGGAT